MLQTVAKFSLVRFPIRTNFKRFPYLDIISSDRAKKRGERGSPNNASFPDILLPELVHELAHNQSMIG